MKNFRKNQGITLIALVITVVILLILAGVSIATLTGDNGLLTKAQQAKEENEKATLEEKIKLLTAENIINEYTGESEEKTAQELQDELKKQGENVLVIQWDKYIIFDLDQSKEYRVMNDGSVEYWGESTMGKTLLNSKTANPDQIAQDSSTSNIIGIDNDGNTVNMLLWEYTLIDDNVLGKVGTYGLNDEEGLNGVAQNRSAGYIGGYTEDGQIIGTVPAYISIDRGNTYIAVTSMIHTFYACNQLIKAPEIPDTVTSLGLTFYQARNLINPPTKIPDSVIDFNYTFSLCENLTSVPIMGKRISSMMSSFRQTAITEFNEKIPDGVINMSGTFQGCTALTSFTSDIPNSVIDMQICFSNCTSLTSFTSSISSSMLNMNGTFQGCTALTSFTSDIPNSVTNMQQTFANCSSLMEGPKLIPDSVTNMMQTFSNCQKLQGSMQINANLDGKIVMQYNGRDYTDYEMCLLNAAKEGDGLVISKSSNCPMLENLFNTKSYNSNITIEN